MVSVAQANQLRAGQSEIRELVEGRMRRIIDYLADQPNLTPVQFRNSLMSQTNLVVSQYGDIAASMAAEWYEDIRLSEVADRFRAIPGQSAYGPDAVDGMVRRAVNPFFGENPDLSAVMRTVEHNAGKYVLSAARETVRRNTFRDPAASGWQRITRHGSCEFCRMLAGRGAVYMRETAFFASHGACNCAAVPSFDRDAPEVDVALYEASRRTTGMTPEQRRSHNELIRNYIEANGI